MTQIRERLSELKFQVFTRLGLDILEAIESEEDSIAYLLRGLAAAIHEQHHPERNSKWEWCIGYLEQAADKAIEAEEES